MLESAGLRPFSNELNYQDANVRAADLLWTVLTRVYVQSSGQPKVIEVSFECCFLALDFR